MDSLPKDDYILLSLVNTRLRDGQPLSDFCEEFGVSGEEVCLRLSRLGYALDGDRFKEV